jgi:hypothetical protein
MSILNYIEKMKEMYEGDRITAQGPRNMAEGGMIIGKPGGLVEEGVEYYATKIYKVTTGSHKGDWALPEFTYDPVTKKKSTKVKYFKSKTDLNNYLKETKTPPKYSKTELNKAAKFFYNLPDNDPRKVSSPKFDELDVKSREWNRVYDRVRAQKGKFSKITQADPLTEIQQNKILKEFPGAKFTPKNKFGFPPGHENYQKVTAFVTRGYKKPFQGTQLQALPKYAQQELIEAFPEVKFDFDRDTLLRKGSQFSKYGVPVSHPKYSKIAKYFAKSKVWKYNFDLRSPEGWMMSQMERNYAQNGEASPYRPITKKGGPIAKGNPMIGIEHNGKKYYMDTINNHPDFNNTRKYWNIADKTSKKYLSEFDNLAKLLPEGFDPKKIQLNDLLQFISDKDGVQGLNRAKRAIQIHHEYGVGPRATTDYQLLRQDMNLLANKTNNLLKSKDLSKVEKGAAQALERNTRLVVDDVRYGPAKVSAAGDIKNIIASAETEMKKFTKKDWSEFNTALKSFCGYGKSTGGRIGFKNGSCSTEVAKRNFLIATNDVRTGRVTGEAAKQITKNAGKVVAKAGSKSALASILGPAGIGIDIAYEVGSVGWDVAKGKPWKEAIQDNWIMGAFVPGTGSEEFHKRLAKINPGAAVYGQAQDLITAYDKKANQIERLKADTTYQGRALAKEQIPLLEKQMKEMETNYNTLTRDNKAMEEGSPEHEKYMSAMTELKASDRAKSWVGSGIKRMDVEPDRYKPRGGMEINYSLPKPVEISQTPLSADQLQAYAEYHRDVGDLEPRGELPPAYIDYLQKREKWRQLFKQPGIRGTQDWRGASGGRAGYMGGGITGIRKPHAIPPERQGLRSIMINGKKS